MAGDGRTKRAARHALFAIDYYERKNNNDRTTVELWRTACDRERWKMFVDCNRDKLKRYYKMDTMSARREIDDRLMKISDIRFCSIFLVFVLFSFLSFSFFSIHFVSPLVLILLRATRTMGIQLLVNE